MNDEMNMNEFNDEVTLDVADEPQIIDLTEPDDILADEEAAPVTNPWLRPGQWLVVHTQAGYEKKVKANLEARIQSLNIEDRIYETVIPMEDVVEFKNGRKQTVQKKVFPGYILVRCIMDDESWYCIRNTPGITGFVGQSQKGQKPTPLSRKEVETFLSAKGDGQEAANRRKPKMEYEVGEKCPRQRGPIRRFLGSSGRNQCRPHEVEGFSQYLWT